MSLHISKHQLQHVDFSDVLYLLIAAALGAGLALLIGENLWISRTASLKAEIVEQNALLQEYNGESRINSKQIEKLTKSENDLKNERNALASQLEEIRIESDQLRNQLQAKSDELTAEYAKLENLSTQNAQLVKHANLLSQCVLEGENFASAVGNRQNILEFTHAGYALKLFNDSWSNDRVCSNAVSIAERYRYPLN